MLRKIAMTVAIITAVALSATQASAWKSYQGGDRADYHSRGDNGRYDRGDRTNYFDHGDRGRYDRGDRADYNNRGDGGRYDRDDGDINVGHFLGRY
jgi:hypothetical protein